MLLTVRLCYTAVLQSLFILHNRNLITIEPVPISPSIHSLATTILLSVFMSILWIPHVSGILQQLSSWNWLILPGIMSSRFTPVIANGSIPFFLKTVWYSTLCIGHMVHFRFCESHIKYWFTPISGVSPAFLWF